MKPSILITPRLILRRATENDSVDLFKNYSADSECSRFLTRLPHSHINQTIEFLEKWCDIPWDNDSDHFAWVVSLAENNEAIGVFLVMIEGHKAQIHFGIGRKFWRQGMATELGFAAMEWLRTQPQLQRIWTVSDLMNHGSIKVLEKLGFENEGILRKWLILPAFGDTARDCHIFSHTWDLR